MFWKVFQKDNMNVNRKCKNLWNSSCPKGVKKKNLSPKRLTNQNFRCEILNYLLLEKLKCIHFPISCESHQWLKVCWCQFHASHNKYLIELWWFWNINTHIKETGLLRSEFLYKIHNFYQGKTYRLSRKGHFCTCEVSGFMIILAKIFWLKGDMELTCLAPRIISLKFLKCSFFYAGVYSTTESHYSLSS